MHLHEIWRAEVRQRHFGYLHWQASSWTLSRGSCCSNFVSTKFSIVAPFLLKIPWWFLFSTESWPKYSPPLAEVMGDSHEARHGANLGLSHGPQGSDSCVCQDFRGKRVLCLTSVNPAPHQQPTLEGVLMATCREPLKTTGESSFLWQKPLMIPISTKTPLPRIWLKMWYYCHFMPSKEEKRQK